MDDTTATIAALLAPLTNWERTRTDTPRFDLEAMRRLLARRGATPRAAPLLIQIGGSKGKGTTAAYVEALARAAGRSTGVYASPHVSSIRERVRIDGAPVDGPAFVAAIEALLAWLAASGGSASAFEVLTAAAVELFAAAHVDVGILEVGLGGRLDATTAVDVDGSVLTSIELEHTAILGDTVEAIATEKAAILRPGKLAVSAVEAPGRAVVRARADAVGCRLLELGADLRATVLGVERDG